MMTTTELLTQYENYMRACGWSERTIELRMSVAATLLRQYGMNITRDSMIAWLATKKSDWTRHTYYSCAQSLFEFMRVLGLPIGDPLEAIPRPKSGKSLPRALSDAEIARIKAVATGDVADMVTLALFAGFRAHEIAKVRGEDVTEEATFVRGKGGVEAFIPTHSEIWAAAKRRPAHGYWFPGRTDGHIASRTVTTRMSAFFTDLGIDGATHRLRHTFATNLLRQGVNLKLVQDLMRHSSLGTTEVYLKVLHDERAAAIRKLPA